MFLTDQQTLPLSLIVHRSDALFHNSKTVNSGLEVNSYVIAASTSMPVRNLPKESLVVAAFLPKVSVLNLIMFVFYPPPCPSSSQSLKTRVMYEFEKEQHHPQLYQTVNTTNCATEVTTWYFYLPNLS